MVSIGCKARYVLFTFDVMATMCYLRVFDVAVQACMASWLTRPAVTAQAPGDRQKRMQH